MRLQDFLVRPSANEAAAFDPIAPRIGESQRREILLKTAQGRSMRAWVGQNVAGSCGEVRTRSIVCDLTPEREWQAALRASERFRRCFANSPVGIALLDRSGRFEEANRAVADLFGVMPQELKGRELIGLLNEDDRDRIVEKIAGALRGCGTSEPVEVRPRRSGDKTMFLFVSRLDAATDGISDGDPHNVCGVTLHFIDVTERKNLEI